MASDRSKRPQSRFTRDRWAIVAATAVLVVGGCATGLSWGAWGVFVTCGALTLVGSVAPALLLLPRSAVTGRLVMQVASCALWLMLIGWGLVMLLYPEYTIGWRFPGKGTGGMRVSNEDEALWMGWVVLGSGIAFAALIITVEILPRIRRALVER